MGDIRNCPECGKIFVKVSRNLCPKCIEKEEEMYVVVRDYIKDHNQCNVDQIVEDTGVDERKVLRWMREGRIDMVFHGNITGLTCKRCGAEITIGEFCPACTQSMMKQFSAPSKPRVESKPIQSSSDVDNREGMFVANRLRKEQ